LAGALAEFLRPGSVVAIEGELGAGKTCFVRGLVAALSGEDQAISPTFTYENRYRIGRAAAEFVHFDLYRVGSKLDADLLRSLGEAREAGAIVAVEWAGGWLDWLEPCLHLEIVIGAAGRELRLTPRPAGWKHSHALALHWQALAGECA
jgi:tRNA threonylcarbamoyladenosine biosynthesis protein TsaE